MSLTIFVEGGGTGTCNQATDCRRAFGELFGRIARHGAIPKVIAGGSQQETLKKQMKRPESIALIDAEGPAQHDQSPSVYQMVQLMESWFLADIATTARILNCEERGLTGNPRIEDIHKSDVLYRLKSAGYDKKRHSYPILRALDPAKIRRASPHADLLFKRIEQGC